MTTNEWAQFYERTPGSHLTQMDVMGGRILTIDHIEWKVSESGQGSSRRQSRKGVVFFREPDVLPWLMPQQEAMLLASLGLVPSTLPGVQLLLDRDPTQTLGRDIVGGTRIMAVSVRPSGGLARWRNGNRSLTRDLAPWPEQRSPIELAAAEIGVSPGGLVGWMRANNADPTGKPDKWLHAALRKTVQQRADDVRAYQAEQSAAITDHVDRVAGRTKTAEGESK